MAELTSGRLGLFGRVHRVRWRIAERVGRALVGGRLEKTERQLARAVADLHEAQRHIHAARRRIADLGDQIVRLSRDRALAADLDRLTARLAEERTRTAETLFWHARSIRWLAERWTTSAPAAREDGPLISVIMPVWNRAGTVGTAIASVRAQTYRRFELLVVDDGSEDDTAAAVEPHLADARVRWIAAPHGGEAAARNRGLAEARGDVVAYLDSDNTWTPMYLAAVAAAFAAHPECATAYAAQLVVDHRNGGFFVRGEPFDRAQLESANYIDVNAFAHRRELVDRFGAFDETLTRLSDWDLILRYTAERDPLALEVLGGYYHLGLPDQVTQQRDYAANAYRVRRKLERPAPATLRVLYALWHYPQLSESYVRAEIAALRRRGVAVEVWSETPPAAPYPPGVPVHGGALADAIEAARPTVVHVHWLGVALRHLDMVAEAGLPMTVRGHGLDFDPEIVRALVASPTVRGVYLFPAFAAALADAGEKVRPMPVCFDPDRYPPAGRKDPRLVVRVAAGLPTKDLDTVFHVARACDTHRVVLAVARVSGNEAFTDALVARNRALGSPVDLRVDLQHEEAAALVADAGIYLHTHGLLEPYGMPISIAEAMATGCTLVARRCPEAEAYVGGAGRCYDTAAEAAAVIRETLAWTDERWRQARLASIERAYGHFTDAVALRPLLDDWLRLAGA